MTEVNERKVIENSDGVSSEVGEGGGSDGISSGTKVRLSEVK